MEKTNGYERVEYWLLIVQLRKRWDSQGRLYLQVCNSKLRSSLFSTCGKRIMLIFIKKVEQKQTIKLRFWDQQFQ